MATKLWRIYLHTAVLSAILVLSFAGLLLSCKTRSSRTAIWSQSIASSQLNERTLDYISQAYSHTGVNVREDENYYYIESDGLPDIKMMVGIRSWQQQLPLPQNYTGTNSWQIPKNPEPADSPVSLRDNLMNGAVGIAVDGVPIFNALNNRGVDSYSIGELDNFGGHCGRADDYHYHIAPTHINSTIGDSYPIAFMLDGYPLYGFKEADGTLPQKLDAHGGHVHDETGYHYHAVPDYPYINQNMYGKINMRKNREGMSFVRPQPRSTPIRPAKRPLPGALITDFTMNSAKSNFSLEYSRNGSLYHIEYKKEENGWHFTFTSPDAGRTTEFHTRKF